MWSFLKDLDDGKKFELTVLDILKSEYPKEDWIQNPVRTGVDILSKSWLKVEVKFDRMWNKTWNIFIEVECNWKPSWIYKYEWLDVLAYWYIWESSTFLYLINVKKLIEEMWKNSFRQVNGWDWFRVKWILVPISYLKEKLIISKEIEIWHQHLQ